MIELIGCCGLDCEKCDARIATLTNDNALREKTAELWTKLNGVTITPEMINCTGCRIDGAKTPFCDKLCPVHNCVRGKGLNTCADCEQMDGCPTLRRITENNPSVMDKLKFMRKSIMNNKASVVIDLQNDITKNYREIIETTNQAIDWAVANGMKVIYIKHNNLSAGTRTFKPDTPGAEFVPELKIVSDNIFVKTKSNALTSEGFSAFIREYDITEFYIAGADAAACVKSTCYNMAKAGYIVHVLSDCVTSYDKRKLPEMMEYYVSKGCTVEQLDLKSV